jgi:antirestriction protein ArdC
MPTLHRDLAQQISDQLIKLMQENGSDWRRPWLGDGIAKNVVSKSSYRGINIPILGLTPYSSPWFATYKQLTELGAQVRKGEKASHIFFWKELNVRDRETEEDKRILMARSYAVFNLEQCDNAPAMPTEARTPIERHAEFDRIIAATGAQIAYGGDRAAYIPSQDRIVMPKADQFKTTEGFCGTLAHECAHWTALTLPGLPETFQAALATALMPLRSWSRKHRQHSPASPLA